MEHDRRDAARAALRQSGVPAIPNATTYNYREPEPGFGGAAGAAAARHGVNPATGRPHLAFVNATSRGAIETLDRVAQARRRTPTVVYPNNGFALALRTVAGAIVRGIGSKVYWWRPAATTRTRSRARQAAPTAI